MSNGIRVGIVGYGNLGRGVEAALGRVDDMQLVGVFTRRDPAALRLLGDASLARPLDAIDDWVGDIDVLLLCGGSRTDLPAQGPALAARFNTVDSFDTHARIPAYFDAMDAAAREGGQTAIISVGWDPGLFSLHRLLGEAVLPTGETHTFWGRGVSQGHSDALRRVPGVADAVQYTIPKEAAMERVRSGDGAELAAREKHRRDCYVVLEPGADPAAVEKTIVTMPDYFAGTETTVTFVTAEILRQAHRGMPHGGFVIRQGTTGSGAGQTQEFALRLESNPEFTASVLVAYARAAHRLHRRGERGARTIFDVPPGLLSPKSPSVLRRELL